MNRQSYVCLDVGEKRIGVAVADNSVKIAIPHTTVEVDGTEISQILEILNKERADVLVVGYPRNQSGEATSQTTYVEEFMKGLQDITAKVVYQDESLTSVLAEQRLSSYGKPFAKGDIDAMAASIILQDYLELNHG